MGGLNSGPGPGITLLIAFVLILCSSVLSAPLYEEDDTQVSNAQGVIEPQGCYYNFQHYNEGERILTNEPCLNCTCRNHMLMCYLRVCPFTKGIGQNCTVEKVPGQCCPIITCPEVPVQLLTSSTTEHSEDDGRRPDVHHGIKGTAVGHLDNNGCQIDGVFYPNGAQVPGNPEKPCELCYCIRNKTACIMQACALHVDGCRPIYEDGQCFPVRYQCDDQPYEEEPTTTIRPAPTPGLIITTTASEPLECFYNNEIYEDGSRIQTEDPCEHCYCLKGKIACAVQECGAPLEKEGQNCTALPPAPGKCCPDSYQCDITMSSQKFGQGGEGTTEAGFSSVADAGHPTDGHYPDEHGATKTTEKPKYGTNQQSGDVTEGLTTEVVTPSKGVSGKPFVTSDGQGLHMDKGQPGSPDSSDLEHHQELDKGTQLPTKHQDSLPNEYEGTAEDVSSVSGEQKLTSTDETKPGVTKRPVYGTKPEITPPNSGFPTIPGSLNELVQRQNQSQTDPISSIHHTDHKDKPQGQKPEQYGDEKDSVSESKPQEPSSADATKVQDGIQTPQGSGHSTTESEHILHVMEQQKPAPGIESHIQDTSSTKRPYDEEPSTLNADSTEKTGSTKPSFGGHWKPQPGIYQPDLQGTPFDVSHEQMSPDRIKPVFPESDKLPEENYGYSTPIPAIDEDQNVKGQMTVSSAKDQLIDKLHNIIQDVQAQVNDGKTTEMPEEADYKTTTQSQKGHFTEKPDTIPHLHHGSQGSHHPLGSGHDVPTTKPTSDKETQSGSVVTDTPKDTSDIFNKIQGIIHGMFTQVTEAVQTTLAPLTTGDVDGKKPSKVEEESSSASPESKPHITHELKPSDGSSTNLQGTKPVDSYEHPDKEGLPGAPNDSDKRPQGSGTKYPGYTESTTRKHDSTHTRYPDGSRPEDSEYPSITQYPDYISPDGETGDYGKYPEGSKPGVTGRPQGAGEYPEGTKPSGSQKYPHYPHGTEYPDEVGSTVTPDEFGKYPDGTSPSKRPEGVKYPGQTGSTGKPHYTPKYPGSKYPQEVTGKPTDSEDQPYGTEYPEGLGVTGRPQGAGEYPEGTKPSGSQKYPHHPHGTEYPDEVGSTVTPDEFGKYPDGTSPVKGSPGVKYPGQTGSTVKPHYSTKYPGSKYPQGVTGKPTDSEDQPYGTEYPEGLGVTGRPQGAGEYPEGTKPSGSQKYPHHPHGTEYPDEVGSTVTPDEFGKYPDGISPVKGSPGVKYPGQTGSTVKPHYTTKFPGSKYPQGVTGKPTDSEDQPYGTEYPEGLGVTGRPQGAGEHPEGTKPSGSEKYPHYPHGTEYPDEVGSTVTPDEFGKYPDGTSPVKGSQGVKYPGQIGSTVKPHYSTKYPGSKYPQGVTGKPTDSEDQPYGTEYPEGLGVTGRPQGAGEYPEGTKPSGSQKYPHYPHGTEYPDEVGSTVTPDEFGKYPDGTSPSKRPEGVKYPGQTESTGKPHYSTKHPGSKYPQGVTGKPTDSEDQPYGTEYPEGLGVTGRPQGAGKYPEGVKPSHSDSERPYGTEYPEGENETDRPYDSSKYPEGTKPVREPDGVVYPGQMGSSSRPQVGDQYLEGTRPPQSEKHPLGTVYPNKEFSTDRPYGANKYPAGFKPNENYPGGSQPTGTELPEYSTMYPNEYDSNLTPDVSSKYPHGSKPTSGIYRPDGTKYPDHTDTVGRPQYPAKYPEESDPAQKPQGPNQHFGQPTGKPFGTEEYPYVTDHPEGQILTGKPHDSVFGSTSRPDDSSKYPYQTKYPGGFTDKPDNLNGLPDGSRPVRPGYRPQDSKYPTGSPFDSTRFPAGSRPTFRPIESGKYPESSTQISGQENLYGTQSPHEKDVTSKPQTTGKYPSEVSRYPDGSKPTYPGKYPETGDSEKPHDSQTDRPEGYKPSGSPQVTSKYPEGLTDKPYDLTKYPQGFKPSDKYPIGTEYPEGVGSALQPNELGKYPDGTSPVKGTEGIKHPDQTESTGRPHYPAKYPGSKYPEGITGKPSDTEDQTYGTEYPGEVGVTGRPQGADKYPETVKPSHSDSERPYGTVYPEGEPGTDRPYDLSKYPDRTKPEGVSYPVQTGSTGRPHYSTKYPGSVFPEGVTDKEQDPHATKYPEDLGGIGRPDYTEKYPEKVKPLGKPDGLGKYPDGVKPSDSNQLQGGEETEKQPGEESETDRPYDASKHPVGYRPNDKYPEGLKPTDSQESTKVPDDGTSESVTKHQVGSTDKVSTNRPDLIKHPEGYEPIGDTLEHPDDSKPTNENESKPDTNTPSGQKKPGKPGEEGLKPEQSEKSPDDTESLNKQGTTGKPDDSSQYPGGVQPISSENYPLSTKYPDEAGSTHKPDEFDKHLEKYRPDGKPADTSKFPDGMQPENFEKYPHGSEHPTAEAETNGPQDSIKYPEGTKPVRGPDGIKYPAQTESSDKPNYSTKYPVNKHPEGLTGKPTISEDQPYGTEYPEDSLTTRPQDLSKYPEGSKPNSQKHPQYPYDTEYPEGAGVTGRPQDTKYPEGTKPSGSEKYPHYPHGTEYPDEVGSTVTLDEFGKYPDGISPVKGSPGVKYPGQTGSTVKPHYTTKYPGSKYPQEVTGKPTDSEDQPYGTEYPEGLGVTGRPQGAGEHPEGTKPSGSEKYPHYPHGTEYPDEVGSTLTPDEFGKYPDGISPVKGSPGVKYPGQTGSTVKPHYSTKYPGSKYPQGVTGKPNDSEDQPYGTEYPEGLGVTGRPQGAGEHPEGTKPSGSEKYPHYPHGTEYPDEVGSTVTPDEFGKYPDGTSPDKGPEGVKYPGQTESTGKPHYTPKYPGSKYPQGVTGKPTDSEDQPYGTEYPEGLGVTGRPQGSGEYPEGTKPAGSEKYPHYPHGTEYPDEVGSTVTLDEFGKYPDGISPVKGSPGIKYPGETGSTVKPHYSTKYPGGKYPQGVTGKPTDSDDQPYGTEYPEGLGVTGRPQGAGEHPEGTKPSGSEKYPHYPHGTEYPDEVGSTVTPDEFGKYPDGISPVKGSPGIKYPGETGSTVKPHYSTKYPGSKYPQGVTGKPTDSEDQPYGTEYPEGLGVTGRPQGAGKYPEGVKPSHSDSERPYGTEYPEGENETDRPYDSSKYPEGTKPIREPDGVKYPEQTASTGRPFYSTHYPDGQKPTYRPEDTNKLSEGVKPTNDDDSTNQPLGSRPNDKYPVESQTGFDHEVDTTEYPEDITGTSKPHDLSKYPDGSQPSITGHKPEKYPESTKVSGKPMDPSKHTEGTQPEYVGHYPHGTEYPDQVGSTDKPYDPKKHPENLDPAEKFPEKSTPLSHVTKQPDEETGTIEPFDFTKHPDGSIPLHSTKYPGQFKPTEQPQDLSEETGATKYPEYIGSTLLPHATSKYPGGSEISGKPEDSNKLPEEMTPSEKKPGAENDQSSNEHPNEILGTDKPYNADEYPEGFKPHYTTKHPAGTIPSDLESMSHSTKYPHEPAGKPDDFEKHPHEKDPGHEPEGVTHTGQTASTESPHYSTKYPGSHRPTGKPQNLLPEGFTGTPIHSEGQPHETEPTDEVGVTARPQNLGKYPEGSKPTSQKHPFYPHGTEYPDEVGSTVTPDEFGKYPDGTSPDKGPEGVKYPGQTESTGKPHYTPKYPGSKYPQEVTGKPADSEDQPYGTEYPEGLGVTDRPQGAGEYPEGTKPSGSEKYPHYPHGTEYPDEVGSTVTPDEFGKYPDGTSPDKTPEGVKYPGQTESTGKPHYTPKYPGSKYPQGVTGKPTDSEDQPYGTEYPEGLGVTDRPQGAGEYPEGTKPSGSQKYPHYPHGTEYPDEVGSTVTPDEFGKYPDGTSPSKRPEGVKYPGQTESTGKPHYTPKYPGSKYPQGVTGKPTDSEDQPYGTEYPEGLGVTDRPQGAGEYPEGLGVTGRPQGAGEYPEGTKPSGSQKYPHYPHGTEYPDEVGSTVTPDEFGKYPNGTSPSKRPEGVKYPGQTGSTGKPHYSTKYPGTKYPDGFTDKPYDSEDQSTGTEYLEGFGVTDVPQGSSNKRKPTFSGERPYGTEYPGEKMGTDKPNHSNEYSEGSKPVSVPEEVKYPDQAESTGRPHYPDTEKHPDYNRVTDIPFDTNKFPGGAKPEDSQEHRLSTKRPDGTLGTTKSHDSSKYPEGVQPSTSGYDVNEGKYPGFTKVTEKPFDSSNYSEGKKPSHSQHAEFGEDTDRPHENDKHPDELKPGVTEKHPDVSKYPSGSENTNESGSTLKPESDAKLPVGFKPTDSARPSGDTQFSHPEGVTDSDGHVIITEHPEGVEFTGKPNDSIAVPGFKPTGGPHYTGKYPEGIKPTNYDFTSSDTSDKYPHGTEYPINEVGSTVAPDESGKYPDGTRPVKGPEGVKHPDQFESTDQPHYSTKYPESKYPEGVTGEPYGTEKPHGTEYPEQLGTTGRPQEPSKYPEGTQNIGSQNYPLGTKYPEEVESTVTPDEFGKYPDGTSPDKGPEGVKYPGQTESTGKPHYSTKHPGSKYPQGVTGKPTDSEDQPYGTEYPEGVGVTGRPQGSGEYPEGTKPSGSQKYPHHPHGTEYPDEVGSTVTPDEFGKYPDGISPVKGSPGVKYPGQTGSTVKPHYTTKYPGSKYPQGVTGKPTDSEDQPYGTEYPEGLGVTDRPQGAGEYPEGTKPSGSQKYPHYPHGTEYPDEVGSTVTLDEFGKYPDGTSPDKTPEGVKYPGQTESTGKPHYSTKHPGSKYPQGVTGKPTDSEDQPYGTEYPEGLGVTDRPQGAGEHPEGTKPSGSQKYPHYPHGTEYPDEVGSTVTPDEFGKYPDGTSPSKRPEGVKYPGQTGSTGKPHYTTKYPGSKYPQGVTGKPTDSEDQPYGTEYPEGLGVTGRPQGAGEYPEGTKPSGSQKYPHYPHGTEYPDEVGSTVTPDEFGKYPDGTSPDKGPEGVKYPGQTESTGKPHYSTKHPGSKYPQGVTGKPTDSEDQPYGTEYPEGLGVTGRPQGAGEHPEGTKPSGSEKYPHYPHGTEYPDEVGFTLTPDEFGKYPDGISPVKGSPGIKYPGETGSTVKPHYSTKYPGGKYPQGVTGKPTDSDDQPYGTEYPEGVGGTRGPQGAEKYPEGVKPSHSDSERPYGTEYPEGETETDRPYDSSKHPEGTKPVRGPDGVKYPGHTESTGRPQGVDNYPEEEKPISEDKFSDEVKPTTSKDSSYGTQYPDLLGGSVSGTSSSTPDASVYDSVSKQPGSMYLPQFPQTGKPFSPSDDKDKPLELPEESYSVKPGHDNYGSSTPKGSESDGLTDKPGVPVSGQSIDEMDVTTHSPDEYPKRPDSADLTHDSEYRPQSGEHGSKHPSETSSTQSPDKNLNAQYPTTKEPSTDQDGKVAPQGVKVPQDDLLATRPDFESPHTEKTLSGVSTPKHGGSKTEKPAQGLSGHDQSTTDQFGSPIKHPDDEQGSTSPGSVNKYSEASDEYSTTEYSNQDGITGKPSGTPTKRPVEQPSRPGQGDVYTTQQSGEGRPTHGVGHPEGLSPGSEGFNGNVYETTTPGNDDLINKLQSIISGIQTQVTNDKTTRKPSTSDLNSPLGQTTQVPHEGEQKPQDHSEQPHESVQYATDKPYVTGDKRRPIDGFDSIKPHDTDKPLAGPVDKLTTGLGEEVTEGYLEEENEIHDPEGHFGKKPQSTKKPSSASSTEFPETGRPTGTKRPSEETVGSYNTKHPEGYTDQPAGKPHDTSVQTQDENEPSSSTNEYPEEGKRPDKVPASGEKVTGKPDSSIHFPDEKPGSPTSESSTPGVSDEHTPTRKTGSTQVGSGGFSSTIGHDPEKPEDFDSSTKEPGTHHDTRPTISQTETGDHVHETSSTPKDGILAVTETPETDSKPQKGVTKPGDRPGVHQPSKPEDGTHPHGEADIPIYHGVESMTGKPTDQPDSMISEDHTVLPEKDSAGTKTPSHGVPLDEETGQVTESGKHPSHQEPTEKPLHVVYPTYYPDGIITRKPGSRPQDLGNKVTVTPQANVYGTSTPSKEDDDATQSVGDRDVMKPTSKVPTDGSSLSSGEPVTEGLDTEGSKKRVVPQEGFTTGDVAGKPHAPVEKHPDSSVDGTQSSGEFSTTSPVIIVEEVHTEVHSERATTKPGTESYDQTTKSVYPHGSDDNLTEKPETFDGKTTKNPDLFSHGTDSVFQKGKPGHGSTVHPLSTDKPQDSLYHTSQPSHGSSVPVLGITESYPDVLVGSTTDESLYQGTGKPGYQTKYPESPDGKSTNEPGLVTDGTTPSADHSGQPGSQHIMNLYSPKDKYSTTISPEVVKGTQQPGSYVTGSQVPGVTEEGSLYTTSKPDDSHQGPTFDHEIFGSKFPGRKTTQNPLVTPEAQPDFPTVFGVETTREPQEGVTSMPTQGMNVEHHVPSFIFPQKRPDHEATEGYITQGKPLTTVGQPGVVFEGKPTTPSYQFITSGTHDPEISTKKPFQPSVKGASYVPYRIIDGRKVYYPEREVSHKPDEADKHGFDGFDYLPYEIINGKKFFKPNEVVSQPVSTSTTPKHRLGMYVPYKIINGTKVYYTEDPQGKPQAGVEDYDGLDYVPFDIINGTKVFYPEAVNEPTSPALQETTTTPSYIMAMYVPYKIINGTKVYYPEDSPNKPESEDYDGLDYVPYEIVNGKKVFYPERVATPPKGASTPSYVTAMYVPYKIINGTKVYYPEDPQGKPQSEDYDGLDYVPFEIVNGTKVFYPERVTATPEATTKPAHTMAMYVPYKIVNGTKVYYPEEPQVDSEVFDGLDYVPFEIVNGTKVFYPERASTTSDESTTTPSYPSAMYVPYKIVDGRKVYYPKYAQYKPYKVPEGFAGFDYIPYEIVNGSKVFYPDRATTVRPTVPPAKHHQGMYVPYKIVNGTKIYYPKDAEEKPQGVLDGYDGSDYVPYEIVNGTRVFYPEKTTTAKPGIKAMYVPYKIVDGTKVYYAKDAQPTPNLIPKGYDGFDFVPYEIVNGTKTFYPERVTTSTPAPNELYYTQGMYVPYKIVDGRKVYYPQRAQHNPLEIPEGFEGFDYILYDIVNGTKVFHPERVTGSPAPTHAPSGTFYPQGMYVPFRVINGTKVFYPQDAQHRPDPMKNDYDGWQHLPYDIVNGTKVFYPERVTTEPPVDTMSAMYVPFKMINGTKVFYVNDAQYQSYLIPEGYDGFEYVPYEIVNGTKKFYPSSHYPTTAKPTKQGMFVPYKIINGAKVYYPKHASDSPRPPSSEYNGVDFIPYEVINGTKVFYPDRIQGPELETSGTQAMYVPYKMVNGTKVFYPKDAQFKPYLIPEGYDGFDYLAYEMKNGTKVFYPERLTVTQRPEQVPSQGMFVPYKMINGQKVYYPKEAQKRPHPLSNEYDGLDYIPYEVVNGTKVFYPEYVTQSADMSGTPMSQAMFVPYKIINGTKVFYPKYAQHKPHLVPDGYDGFEYVPYKIVNGTKFFYPDRVATKPQKLQGMYVPYKIINGTKVFYPKYAQPTLQQLPKGFDGIDYIPYEVVNGTKVFYPEKATPSGVSGTPVVQALYVPYKTINGKKVFYPKYAVERPQTIPEGYDGFAYMPYSIVNGTKMFYPEQAQFPGVNKVPSLQGTFVPYKLLNSTKVFYPKYANDESPRVPDGYDGVDYVPYEPVNGTKVFYPELISPQASSGTSPVPGKYVPYKVVNGKKVFYPKEGKPQYPSDGVRYPYDGIVYVPYKSLSGTSPPRPENYPPFVTPEHGLYGQNSEIVYVDDDDESFRPQFISQSRPSQEQTGGHIGHVPGEGSCFLNNKTYENNMEIPPVSPCQSRCRCINSIVRCVRIKCPPLPQTNTANCSPVYDEGSCCPTYSCENDDLDYLTTTEYPEMVLTGSSSTVISFGQGFDSTTQFAVTDASPHKTQYGQDGADDFSGEKPHPSRKPVTSDGQHPTDQYHIHRPQKPKPSEQGSLEPYDGVEGHPMPGEFSSEDDYDGEDEEPYGPGTCRYAGKVYVSAQQIPRDDPCDFCFCFRSDIICLQQSCPPPIPGCRDEPIQGFCCPRYECHVKMATLLNVTSTTTTTTTTLPPHFFLHPYKGSATRTGCFVQGKAYRVGQAIPSASGPCMDCICRGNGRMECEPKVCTPEPMIRKMIVPAENTTSPSSER